MGVSREYQDAIPNSLAVLRRRTRTRRQPRCHQSFHLAAEQFNAWVR